MANIHTHSQINSKIKNGIINDSGNSNAKKGLDATPNNGKANRETPPPRPPTYKGNIRENSHKAGPPSNLDNFETDSQRIGLDTYNQDIYTRLSKNIHIK